MSIQFKIFPPALIFLSESLGTDVGGTTNGPVVRILKTEATNRGGLEHELLHVKQFWTMFAIGAMITVFVQFMHPLPDTWFYLGFILSASLHSLLYKVVLPYRQHCELSAYRVQLQYSTNREADALRFGRALSSSYGLKISAADATRLLTK